MPFWLCGAFRRGTCCVSREGQQLGPGRALRGVCHRTFPGTERSQKTCMPGTVLGLRSEASAVRRAF